MTTDYEKLGAFYLGKVYDPEAGEPKEELLLYDSKDLTTHALCVGMTGSGKTGLCIGLLEEAAIDGVPALIIDPKGDLGNLMLTFPKLRARDFRPWVDPQEAARKGMDPDEFAENIAGVWKKGLASWGQEPERIQRLKDSAEVAIYTPGSSSGRPLRVLRSLAAPSAELLEDGDLMRERVQAAVSGLLSMLDIEPDPIRSREHILLSNLVDRAWREGRDLELATLIAEIQSPPFDKLGVLDLESFFPAKDRFELAMTLNNLLASPGFSAWMEGEPLDVGKLLYTEEGKPRLAILSIAHLGDRERMFFVTLLLNEVISWMRAQPGTSSLRALLYMDEVFGYFPPTANPPSKTPMLTLLKQARAYGLGVVLATQNPVDLDYKGLSNCGTWFLGRLQTERDKARVLDGLEGAAVTSGSGFDRQEMDRMLSGLSSRVFLMNNVHDDNPELFHTRWVMSYLRGPLTRDQIRALSAPPPTKKKAAKKKTAKRKSAARKPEPEAAEEAPGRPLLPPEVDEVVLGRALPAHGNELYRPALFGKFTLHWANVKADVDHWETRHLLVPLAAGDVPADPWAEAERLVAPPNVSGDPVEGVRFGELPTEAARAKSYASWAKRLKTAAYRDHALTLLYSKKLKCYSKPGEDASAFKARVAHAAREARDIAVEKLRAKYEPKLGRLAERIEAAEDKVEVQQEQHSHQKLQTVVSLGATVLGALFGRRASSIGRAATTMNRASRTSREKGDVARAKERVEELQVRLDELEAEFEEATAEVSATFEPEAIEVDELIVRPKKTDISIDRVALAWTPWSVSADGIAERGL